MNILLIGNGFDLAHGLPTKYTDFLEFVKMIKIIKEKNNICLYSLNGTKKKQLMIIKLLNKNIPPVRLQLHRWNIFYTQSINIPAYFSLIMILPCHVSLYP